jgi:hypothetical protein
MAVFLALISFLWLVVSGWSGWAFFDRDDRIALIPFMVALVLREGFAVHSIAEAEITFASGPTTVHSIVFPLLQLFFVPLVPDPQWFILHLNGLLGALATIPLYAFARLRTGDRVAGYMAALALAADPIVTRMAPTDGPSSLILLSWFTALAFLTQPEPTRRSIFAGSVLLAIAATSRLDGVFLVIASGLLMDWRLVRLAMQKHGGVVAVSAAVFTALVALQFHYVSPISLFHPSTMLHFYEADSGGSSLQQIVHNAKNLTEIFVRSDWISGERVFEVLLMAGALAGFYRKPYRLGTLTAAAAVAVLWAHFSRWDWFTAWHRLVEAAALQSLLAGIGAAWLASYPAVARRGVWVLAGSLALAVLSSIANRGLFCRPSLLNQEYDIVRRNLASSPSIMSRCTLLSIDPNSDRDVHDFRGALPSMRVIQCRDTECIKAVSMGGCFYYLRSAASLRWTSASEPDCTSEGSFPQWRYRDECLVPEGAALEKALRLEAVDVRTVPSRDLVFRDPKRPLLAILWEGRGWFEPNRRPPLPVSNIEIGLFRVLGVKEGPQPRTETGSAPPMVPE